MTPWDRPQLRDSEKISSRTRKDVYMLTPRDLERCPVWELALDEEDVEGQTEETLRPLIDAISVDAREGIYIVRTEFMAGDGSIFHGYCTPNAENALGHIQPVIVTYKGHVHFWYGGIPPAEEDLRGSYGILEMNRERMFPVKFRSLVSVRSGSAQGTVTGFQFLSQSRAITDVT